MVGMKNTSPSSATVCIPAHNEAATIGHVINVVQEVRRDEPGLISEIVVIDDRSTDATALIARAAGARVISTGVECRDFGGSSGKGDALWAALRRCSTDLVAFIDADLTELSADRVRQLIDPLRNDSRVQLVKGTFRRNCTTDGSGAGRVTMLTARPLLSLLHPELASLQEPLSGLFAGRVETLGSLWLDCDYGVDVGIVLDIATMFGRDSIVEVDLGEIRHRKRDLASLSITAEQVARAILARSTDATVTNADLTVRRFPPRQLPARPNRFAHSGYEPT
jgi:glucosyl-3-phosphoglycerate synthase